MTVFWIILSPDKTRTNRCVGPHQNLRGKSFVFERAPARLQSCGGCSRTVLVLHRLWVWSSSARRGKGQMSPLSGHQRLWASLTSHTGENRSLQVLLWPPVYLRLPRPRPAPQPWHKGRTTTNKRTAFKRKNKKGLLITYLKEDWYLEFIYFETGS